LDRPKEIRRGYSWRYKTGKIVLRLSPETVVWPRAATSLTCTMDFAVAGESTISADSKLTSEIRNMTMEIEYSAESVEGGAGWSQFWHFDTHRDEKDTNAPAEIHPLFHAQHGGRGMEHRRELDDKCWGKTLELSSPRLVHPPMDVVLALDFVLGNGSGTRWREEFLKEKEYVNALSGAQQRFWRPHQEMIANFFTCHRSERDKHAALLVMPSLIKDFA
jgi:hypothetical protein